MIKKILEMDYQVSSRLRLPEAGHAWRLPAVILAHSGDSWFWLAALLLVWITTRNAWHARVALMAVGLVLLAALVLLIKLTIRRQRPEGKWGAIYRNTDPHSFPSGHAARAVFLAVLATGLGPAWFAVILVIWAPLVSVARVALGVHYVSDVLAGIVLGFIAGMVTLILSPWIVQWLPFLFN
jgi:undecaprenyl-diphosphatase